MAQEWVLIQWGWYEDRDRRSWSPREWAAGHCRRRGRSGRAQVSGRIRSHEDHPPGVAHMAAGSMYLRALPALLRGHLRLPLACRSRCTAHLGSDNGISDHTASGQTAHLPDSCGRSRRSTLVAPLSDLWKQRA